MDFMWYDYILLGVGIVFLFLNVFNEVPSALGVAGAVIFALALIHAHHHSEVNGRRANAAAETLVAQGYPRPSDIDGGSQTGRWSQGSCRVKFKVKKKTNGDWTVLVTHSNGSVSVPMPAQVKSLLSNPLCS